MDTVEEAQIEKSAKIDDQPHYSEKMDVDLMTTSKEPVQVPDRFRATNLYDRQIRLWGWEAQQRLMKSRLFLHGMDGVGAEVLKNLILGGIKHVTIADDAVVHDSDLTTNFFLRREDFGLNRAVSSRDRAHLLNQTCDLTALEGSTAILTEHLLKTYDLVVLNGVTISEAIRVNKICRGLGIPLFVSQVLGFHAFYVNDLNGLEFEVPPLVSEKSESVKTKPATPAVDANAPSTSRGTTSERAITFMDDSLPQDHITQQLTITCPDLGTILTTASALRSGQASPMPKRMFGLKRVDPYLNLEMIFQFAEEKSRYPQFEHCEEDLKGLEHILTGIRPTGDTRVVEPTEMVRPVANFTCAIFGGTLAQEIITVLTRRGYPIFNLYYLAAMDAIGSREYLE